MLLQKVSAGVDKGGARGFNRAERDSPGNGDLNMPIMNNYTLQTLRKILSDKYGLFVKTAVQNLNLDLLGDDDALDDSIFTAYTQLYMLEDRSNKMVGITAAGYSILSLVVNTIYEVIFTKLIIPSAGMNYGLRYLLGFKLSNELFIRDEESSSEILSLLHEFAIAFSSREFADHLNQFKLEASLNGYKESSWYFSEFHHEIDSNPFILGSFHGHSGQSREQIDVTRISESMNTQEEGE